MSEIEDRPTTVAEAEHHGPGCDHSEGLHDDPTNEVSKPSTDEAIVCRSCWIDTAVSDGLCAECLAARPAVDVEGIARVLAGHQRMSHGMTYNSPDGCLCGARIDRDPIVSREDSFVDHQAQAVVAYLAGEGRG